jgi:hypothetical protein
MLILSACTSTGQGRGINIPNLFGEIQPTFVPHDPPNFEFEYSEIEQFTQCTYEMGDARLIDCSETSPIEDLGCDYIFGSDVYLQGLDPAVSVLGICARTTGLYYAGCGTLDETQVNWILLQSQELVLVESVDQLREMFQPIESADEALSYAMLATGKKAVFDVGPDTWTPNASFAERIIEGTYVESVPDGYIVHLFDDDACSCTPWLVNRVDVLVKRDGTVSAGPPQFLLEYGGDNMCVD